MNQSGSVLLSRRVLALLVPIVMLSLQLGAPSEARAQVGDKGDLINPNRASGEELLALPHIDDKAKSRILELRPFASVSSLQTQALPTLTPEQADELYRQLFIPLNLNTASREEILLIPGVGGRMAHEFEEYRPYRALAQFRREIGKYVDDGEVARLEQYVFVPIDLNTASDEAILSIPGVGKRMLHEFKEYRPYQGLEQFRREIGKYVDEAEVGRLERYVTL